MTRASKPLILAGLSMPIVVGVGAWGSTVDPGHPARWAFVAFFWPALWVFVERAQGGDRSREKAVILRWHRTVIAWGAFMMAHL